MEYQTKKWTVAGEVKFPDNYLTLLNPTMKVMGLHFSTNNAVHISLTANENNGVFQHNTNITWINTTESNVNEIVYAAMLSNFPTAVVSNQ